MIVNKSLVQVIAVIEDLPQNSHFNFEYLESMTPDIADYDGLEFFTYLKFREGVHLEKAVEKSNQINRKVLEGYNTLNIQTGSELEPLTSIHLST